MDNNALFKNNRQPKRGEGPFILELSDGCSGLSIPYRWLTRAITGNTSQIPFLPYCIEHDEAYWYGGSEQQRLDADLRLFHGVRSYPDSIIAKIAIFPIALLMLVVPRIVGSPKLPTPFRWMRREQYSPTLAYTVDNIEKDSTVATVNDAKFVMMILDDPDTEPSTIEESITEYQEWCDLSEILNMSATCREQEKITSENDQTLIT